MSDPNFKIITFFSLAFLLIYFANIATIWLVCRYVKAKRNLNFLFICQAIVVVLGICLAINVPRAIDADESIPKDQRALLGLVIVFFNYILPMASSMLTVKLFFPKVWQRYWQIRAEFR
jgi:hypothetical protein